MSRRRINSLRTASPRRRSAFTLLEVLVALALSVLLITAVYSAISLYVRVTTDEHNQLERSRVARALFRQISTDIQSVVFRIQEDAEEELTDETLAAGGADDSSGSAATGSESAAATTFGAATDQETTGAEALINSSIGVIGDAQKITLHLNRPARGATYQPVLAATEITARCSDLQSITYFLANPSMGGLEGEVGQRAVQGSLGTESGPQGLARLAGDRFAVDYADVQADIETLAAAAQIIAPEVIALQFEYFDGLTWLETWDSAAVGRLPNAIAITIGMRRVVSDAERREFQYDSAARAAFDEVLEYRRHVVALPLSTPSTEGL
ncbi:MAG: prepilin-type N-terminal cleavage/methylation domain-containing protein [Planctomycetaceae bacterium]